MLLLSPGNSACMCVACLSNHFYCFALKLHSLHSEVHSVNVFYANICTKKYKIMANMLFYGFNGAYGVWVVCEPLFSTVVHTLVQTNVASNAFVLLVPDHSI